MRYEKPEVSSVKPAIAVIQGSPVGSKNDTTMDSSTHVTAAAYEADE